MTRILALTIELTLLTGWAIAALITWLSNDYQWAVTCTLGILQSCTQLQVMTHSAKIDRWHDVIGAWRRQDPNAWRRP